MDLIILCGLQASGKTTFRKSFFDGGSYVIVSKDLMGRRSRKWLRQDILLKTALEEGLSVVVDNTNPRVEDRLALIAIGRRYDARVLGYHFRSTVAQSLERNSRREGKALVSLVGILGTAKVYVPPSLKEGFDELYEVTWGPEGTFTKARVQ